MEKFRIIIHLTRLDKPIGILLLFWPCTWGLALGYYFNNECYHLDYFPLARAKNKIELTTFSDDEYKSFITSLLSDL